MRAARWLASSTAALTAALGVVAGLALALLTQPVAAKAGEFTVSVVVQRDHAVNAGGTGPEPIFYVTVTEGGCAADPECNPTGVWAPGDTWHRTLIVRNIDERVGARLSGIRVSLREELALAAWFDVQIDGPGGVQIYRGRLDQLAAGTLVLDHPIALPPGTQAHLHFEVGLRIDTDQALQGRTVKADFAVQAQPDLSGTPLLIDIHPNSWPNPIRPGSPGTTPVAVNGGPGFDVRLLLPETVRFGPRGAAPRHWAYEDWNRDGHPDLLVHVPTAETGIRCGESAASLTVIDQGGRIWTGLDAIVTPGCK